MPDLYQFAVTSGSCFPATADHKFLENKRGWVKASDLQIGDSIRVGSVRPTNRWVRITCITKYKPTA